MRLFASKRFIKKARLFNLEKLITLFEGFLLQCETAYTCKSSNEGKQNVFEQTLMKEIQLIFLRYSLHETLSVDDNRSKRVILLGDSHLLEDG